MASTTSMFIVIALAFGAVSAAPTVQANLCGGALTEYNEGGIFYKFNEELSNERELCVWTVTPGQNSSFNGLRFTLISEDFDTAKTILTIAYATADGQIVERKTFEHGDLSSVDIPSTVAFVIFSTEYNTEGSGFVLYYEGINQESTSEPLPVGGRLNLAGESGSHQTTYAEKDYSVYVFQDSYIVSEELKNIQLTVKDFNTGVGPTSHLDNLYVWGIMREAPGLGVGLLVQPIVTVSGSASRYNSQTITIDPQNRQVLVAILRGGRGGYPSTQVTLEWKNV